MVKDCFYVDDLLTGANNERDILKIKNEVSELLKKGGFNVTKWKANGTLHEHFEFKENEQQSVLGLCWNLRTDMFFYKIREH